MKRQVLKYLIVEDTDRVLGIITNPRHKFLFSFVAYTGLMLSDGRNLNLGDVNGRDVLMVIREGYEVSEVPDGQMKVFAQKEVGK